VRQERTSERNWSGGGGNILHHHCMVAPAVTPPLVHTSPRDRKPPNRPVGPSQQVGQPPRGGGGKGMVQHITSCI
jgi:hypothetical protein